MAVLDYRRDCRLLRPLLGFEKAELEEAVRACGQSWAEDPSNASDLYERNRVRKRLAVLPHEVLRGLDSGIAAAQEARMADQRVLAAKAQAWVRLSPLGTAWVDARAWDEKEEVGLGLLARVICCVGGRLHAPSRNALARAFDALRRGDGVSLGGCVARPTRGGFWLVRERRGAPRSVGGLWDGRFRVGGTRGVRPRYPRGAAECAVLSTAFVPANGELPPPVAVLEAIPLLEDADGVCVPPPLRYDPGFARFAPPLGLTACADWLAPPGAGLMY